MSRAKQKIESKNNERKYWEIKARSLVFCNENRIPFIRINYCTAKGRF